MHHGVPFEPWRVKVVESLGFTTREERERLLDEAGWNLFRIPSDKVLIDLLTDSGTSAMSNAQHAALAGAREAYAGSEAFFSFQETVRSITGMPHVLPVHQGRAAEKLLFSVLGGKGRVIPGNTHFDTTRANIEATGAEAVDLPVAEALDHATPHAFKGNIDVAALAALVERVGPERIPCCVITITNNSVGGQPVSLENVRRAHDALLPLGIPLFLDAARFAENAWFVAQEEASQRGRPIDAIARSFFDLADGALMSAKKDGLVNMGGFLAVRDAALFDQLKNLLILWEGFPTYGGLSARDLAAIAVGLREALDPRYLDERIGSVRELGERLVAEGVPILLPTGGHAVFVDAGAMLPHIPREEFPGQALACALYLEAGVRSCEIGGVMFAEAARGRGELLRLAIPRRVYTRNHLAYVACAVGQIRSQASSVRGMRITSAPSALRHFTATFEPLPRRAAAIS